MPTTITTHKRGFFGRIWQLMFWLFQIAMVGLVVVNLGAVGEAGLSCKGNEACEVGAAIGGGTFAAVGGGVWIIGTLVLGILMLATKGKLVTRQVD